MTEPTEGPGETLRAAREAMEISCREVAEALNLPLHIVEAIEANDYEAMPGPVFTRGYIRAYAKLLELDSDPVVARYPMGDSDTETTEIVPAHSMEALFREHARWVQAGAGLLVIIVLVVWLWPSADDDADAQRPPAGAAEPDKAMSQERPTRPSASPGTPVPGPRDPERSPIRPIGATTPAPGFAAETNPGPGVVRPVADPVTVTTIVPSPEPLREAAAGAAPPATAPAGVRRITPEGGDRLWFRFTDDCWVEIKSASGANLYSDLSRGGRTLDLVGQAPFRILLGYAPGVEVAFNDEAVALAPHTRNNVANLVLGQ